MIKKCLILFMAAFFSVVCATRPAGPPAQAAAPPPPPGPTFNIEEKVTEAEALAAREGYVHLCRAFSLYQEIEKRSPDRSRFAKGYAMTALLLAARAKDVGIRNGSYLDKARDLVLSDKSLTGLASVLAVADLVPIKIVGVWSDDPGPGSDRRTEIRDLERMGSDLEAASEAGPFFAYFRSVLLELADQGESARAGLDDALAKCPDSLLLKFKRATLPPADGRLLEEITDREPEFFESSLERGQLALDGGALITAEKHLLRAYEGIPDSPLISILLSSVNFGTEEYDRSLDFYEKTLLLAPEYKEAGLGKAICLSCLGRTDEAIPMLEDLMARGPALRGECLFWLAADLHDIGDKERAAAEVERAKLVLPVARVFTLAGTIALERGLLDAAEKDLKIAVGMDTGESDAFFGLGKLYARRSAWLDSALSFMLAGYGFESDEKKILEKIGQVSRVGQSRAARDEGSPMSEERKSRLLARKRFQLEKTRLTKATAQFDAAAGYYNAGDFERASAWARQAAGHPYFAEKTKDLLALLASRK